MNRSIPIVVPLMALLVSQPAFAYLDPASGSMILQAILGGIAGLAVAGKLFWHRVLAFFGLGKSPEDESGDDNDPH